jgi:hypothetical protein
MSEAAIEKRLVDEFKRCGGWALKLLPTYVRGIPDRLCLARGRVWFVETKAPGEKARASQKLVHRKLEKMGFPVLLIDTPEKVDELVAVAFPNYMN